MPTGATSALFYVALYKCAFGFGVVVLISLFSPSISWAAAVQASAADSFIDSIGVCTHWSYPDTPYGSNYSTVKQRLLDSGIRHVRDGGANSTVISRMKDLASNGVQTVYVMDPGSGVVPTTNYWSPSKTTRYLLVDFIKSSVGTNAFSGLEIMNEIDLFYRRDSFISDPTQAGYFWIYGNTAVTNKLTNDVTSPLWWGNYITNITRDAWQAMKADPATARIPVIGPSLGKTYGYGANPLPAGCLSNYVDWGCFHPYPGGNPFSDHFSYVTVDWYIGHGGQPSANIDEYRYGFSVFQPTFGSKPMAATETGYFTGTHDYSVTEAVQAKYVPRLYLEYFRSGIPRTCLYEFVDEFNDPANDQANRGLLRNDLTPKPAYTALQNLISLLQDPGSAFTPGALDYSVTKNPPAGYTRTQYVRHQLFQKRDGTFWLVLYHEIANSSAYTSNGVFTSGTTRSISHPAIPVTISFNTPVKQVLTFLPNTSTNATGTNVAPSQLQIDVTDEPVILRIITNAAPRVQLTSPAVGAIVTSGQAVVLRASAEAPGGSVTNVAFFCDTNKVGQSSTAPYTLNWANPPLGYHLLRAQATDNDGASAFSSPVAVLVSLGIGVSMPITLVSTGAIWKYLDDGSDQGTAWREPTFDDSLWKSGLAQFGYGDGDERTIVSYGTSSSQKFITTWFRYKFDLGNLWSLNNWSLRLLRDDGAVVYLNGREVFRSNMPTGAITYTTLAVTNVGGPDETTHFYTANITPTLVNGGDNVLAVEVHQSTNNSSDLSFDLGLAATFTDNRVRLSTEFTNDLLAISWPITPLALQLEFSTNLEQPAFWQAVPNNLLTNTGLNQIQIPISIPQMYFRVVPGH